MKRLFVFVLLPLLLAYFLSVGLLPTASAQGTTTPIEIDTKIVALILIAFFTAIAFISREAFMFVIAGVISFALGIMLGIQSLTAPAGWLDSVVALCLIFYGLFMPIAGLRASLKGGRQK